MCFCFESSLQPLHSPPNHGKDIRVCLLRSHLAVQPFLSSSPPEAVNCCIHGNLHLPPLPLSFSFHPLLSTFNLHGITDSVFCLHLIFSLLLFVTFKPLPDISRSYCLQGEGRAGWLHQPLCGRQMRSSSGIGIQFPFPPLIPTHCDLIAVTPVSRKQLARRTLMINCRRGDKWMKCPVFAWLWCLHLMVNALPCTSLLLTFAVGLHAYFLSKALPWSSLEMTWSQSLILSKRKLTPGESPFQVCPVAYSGLEFKS